MKLSDIVGKDLVEKKKLQVIYYEGDEWNEGFDKGHNSAIETYNDVEMEVSLREATFAIFYAKRGQLYKSESYARDVFDKCGIKYFQEYLTSAQSIKDAICSGKIVRKKGEK